MIKNIRENRGITLIALVITIVVLIILAAVAINTVLGENGILARAKQAALMQKKAQYTEEIGLEIIEEQTDRQIEASEEAFIASINERLTGEKQASNQAVSTYTKKPWIESTIMCDEEKEIHSDPFDNNRLYVYTTEGYELVIAVNNQSLSASIEEGSFQKTADKVNVTYNVNGGTGDLEGDSVLPGFKVKLRENGFIRNRYTFTGWCKNQDGSGEKYQPGTEIKITEDTTLYAVWSLNTVTITFDSNTGSGEMLPRDIDAGEEYQLTKNTFTKEGYEFSKWTTNTDGTGNEYLNEGNITINNNITLYAQWTVKNYSITYALNGGSLLGQKTEYTIEDAAFTIPNPTKDGYTFAGWTGTDLNSASTSVTVPAGSTGTRAYTATWNAITYNITYTLNGGTGVSNRTYTIEDEVVLPVPTRTNYTFVGWTGSNGTTAQIEVTISAGTTGNKSYTANWFETSKQFDYTTNQSGNGIVQTYSIPATGLYKLETYGAQGGTANTSVGGKGGYSIGYKTFNKGDILYICVGSKGSNGTATTGTVAGGYNGGGTGYATTTRYGSGGGGATHIAINNDLGELRNYNSNRTDILIVAGGGGGSGWCTGPYYGTGGAGGGTTGGTGYDSWASTYGGYGSYGASQSSYGNYASEGNSSSIAGFGYGGRYANTTYGCNGGGSGWYGASGTSREHGGAGGGSGYIGGVPEITYNNVKYTPSTQQGVNSDNGKAIVTLMYMN